MGVLAEVEAPEDLAKAISDLAGDEGRRNALAKISRREIESHYSFQRVAERRAQNYEMLTRSNLSLPRVDMK